MEQQTEGAHTARLEEAKTLASRLMHMHYCDGNAEGVSHYFAPQFTWFGAGEEQYIAGREAAIELFGQFGSAVPRCDIWGEEYDAIEPVPGVYVVSGRMWIATAPDVEMYVKVHQRVSFVFQTSEQGLLCAHIHCSNPYQELVGGELFPEKLGRQSYEFVQDRLAELEAQTAQQNRQMDVVLSSVAGGLKISWDDDTYSFAFVSSEAAALFGYTVEEFMAVTGGSAVGAVYPPDLEHALADCAEAFKDGGLSYSTRYRIRCKDGSLKWIIDSGKKTQDADGNWMVNSLYLDVTKAEEDAQRIREQGQLLASIYDTVPCGIIRFLRREDGSCELISLNRAALSLLGYESQQEAEWDWREGVLGTVLPQDQETLRQAYDLLRDVGDRQDREYRARWRDGSLHYLDGTNMVVSRIAEGRVIQRTLVDITQRKALQQQLEQEQEMYRVAMESSSDTLFEYLIDSDTFISYEPQPGQGVFRREMSNYTKRLRDKDFIHPEDSATAIDNIVNGRGEVFEVRVVEPGGAPGDYRWHRVSSRLIAKDGRPSRMVGTIRNIHSMKETISENSERLHMSQSALQAISGVYVSIFYVNLVEDAYYAVRLPRPGGTMSFPRVGSFSGDLRGGLLPHVREGDRPRVAQVCDRAALLERFSHISGHADVEFQQDGPENTWLRLEVHPISVEDTEATTAIVTLRNVSEEKQRELERQAEESAAKQALEEAYEGARRANLAKSDFLSRMSHDIRTPMNAILGMESIAEQSLDDRARLADCLTKIRVSGDHLLGLINDVLDMSKIESGSVSLSENAFLLSETLDAVEQIIRPDAERKGQQLTIRTALNAGAVRGDPMRIQQILLNLLSNAVKYTGEGGHISLMAEEKLSSQSGVGCFEFTVEDDGIGIAPEFMARLFQPFERAEDARVSHIQGTGLGLSITHNLVQMMNGNIQVESQPGRGTRFVVTVFLKLSDRPDQLSAVGSRPPKAYPAFQPGHRVLVVEDNAINREIAEYLLQAAGLETECAMDGQEAVELFRSRPAGEFALILMDIQMPVMDGYDATRAIRRLGETGGRPDAAEIPIVALTANAFADDVYQARQAGMNAHVTKPLKVEKLMKILHEWLD